MIHQISNFWFFERMFFSNKDIFLMHAYLRILALDLPIAGESFYQLFESSLVVSRAWRVISFWVVTPFWVSSLHAQPVLPVLTRIPPELKGDPSRVPLFQGGTYYICECPATHGLGANNSPFPWLSTHAALVSPAKEVARETRKRRESSPDYYFLISPRFHDKLLQAQSIRPNKVIPHEKSPESAQGMNHTLSLAPQGVLIQGET